MTYTRFLNRLLIVTTTSIFVNIIINSNTYGHSDLLDIYKLAEKNDVIVKQQREIYNATQEEEYITRGDLLPQIDLSASRSFNKITHVGTPRRFYSKGYDLELEQVLFDWAKWHNYLRTTPLITSAEKTWYQSNQDLILRVSERYINILNAQDTLLFTQKEYEAIKKLYEESKVRFDVGQITVADIDQVKADLDAITSNLILRKTEVENNKDILEEIINTKIPELATLKEPTLIPEPDPQDMNKWLETARKYNLNLQTAHANRLVANHDISIADANFLPVVNLYARLRGSDNRRIAQQVFSPIIQFTNSFRVAVEIESPNLNPYGSIARKEKAQFEYHKSDEIYIETYRKTERLISQYYREVQSTKKEVAALKQAVIASQSALDSTQERFDVGTRTYVIVLERISDLYSNIRDYKDAIYRHILSHLNLENAAGRLNINDVVAINKMLYKHNKPIKNNNSKINKPANKNIKSKPDSNKPMQFNLERTENKQKPSNQALRASKPYIPSIYLHNNEI